jgi:hypothetical protein
MSNRPSNARNITQSQQFHIDTKTAVSLHCPRCHGMVFMPAMSFYIISAIQSANGQEQAAGMQVLDCLGCSWTGQIQELLKMTKEERETVARDREEKIQ